MSGRSITAIANQLHAKPSKVAQVLTAPQYEKHRQKAYEAIAG